MHLWKGVLQKIWSENFFRIHSKEVSIDLTLVKLWTGISCSHTPRQIYPKTFVKFFKNNILWSTCEWLKEYRTNAKIKSKLSRLALKICKVCSLCFVYSVTIFVTVSSDHFFFVNWKYLKDNRVKLNLDSS